MAQGVGFRRGVRVQETRGQALGFRRPALESRTVGHNCFVPLNYGVLRDQIAPHKALKVIAWRHVDLRIKPSFGVVMGC